MTAHSGLREKYRTEAAPAMREKFGYPNLLAVPRIVKVVVNMGAGRLREEKEREEIQKYLALITGQKPQPRPAKKAIAAFKTREGLVVGYRVTLHGKRMYDFLERLIRAALPRARDFRGIDPSSFDSAGNLTLGVKEHIVFPEMLGEDYRFLFGLEITVATSAKRREEGIELLRLMGFPIQQL